MEVNNLLSLLLMLSFELLFLDGFPPTSSQHYPVDLQLVLGLLVSLLWGEGQGGGRPGEKGREVYRRREKRGREAGFPRWREAGEKGENYPTLRNISQSKKCKGAGAKKYRAGTGIKGYGRREV